MDCTHESHQSYSPWVDEISESIQKSLSGERQQVPIPKKMKVLIDGDLASIKENPKLSTRDRLREKLRQRQNSEIQKAQDINSQVASENETTSSRKRRKRRKKSKKAKKSDDECNDIAKENQEEHVKNVQHEEAVEVSNEQKHNTPPVKISNETESAKVTSLPRIRVPNFALKRKDNSNFVHNLEYSFDEIPHEMAKKVHEESVCELHPAYLLETKKEKLLLDICTSPACEILEVKTNFDAPCEKSTEPLQMHPFFENPSFEAHISQSSLMAIVYKMFHCLNSEKLRCRLFGIDQESEILMQNMAATNAVARIPPNGNNSEEKQNSKLQLLPTSVAVTGDVVALIDMLVHDRLKSFVLTVQCTETKVLMELRFNDLDRKGIVKVEIPDLTEQLHISKYRSITGIRKILKDVETNSNVLSNDINLLSMKTDDVARVVTSEECFKDLKRTLFKQEFRGFEYEVCDLKNKSGPSQEYHRMSNVIMELMTKKKATLFKRESRKIEYEVCDMKINSVPSHEYGIMSNVTMKSMTEKEAIRQIQPIVEVNTEVSVRQVLKQNALIKKQTLPDTYSKCIRNYLETLHMLMLNQGDIKKKGQVLQKIHRFVTPPTAQVFIGKKNLNKNDSLDTTDKGCLPEKQMKERRDIVDAPNNYETEEHDKINEQNTQNDSSFQMEQSDEISKVSPIESLDQMHYGIRLCMFD